MPEMNIKLFVCCHQKACVPEHPLLVPIQVGTALTGERFDGWFHDDTGENISAKNRAYCELTAQYWAWKNCGADYYGFFHYRRYLYPDAHAKRPYRIERTPDEQTLKKLGYPAFSALIEQYDLILPKAENMYRTVREHYDSAPHHHAKDLELAETIVRERSPEIAAALTDYLSGTMHYFGNIFIMHSALFREYCAWLFPVLEEFDRRADLTGYGPQEKRVDGYLAERLLGGWYFYRRERLKTLELPRVHFHTGREYAARRILNAALPPGTRRRALIKRLK